MGRILILCLAVQIFSACSAETGAHSRGTALTSDVEHPLGRNLIAPGLADPNVIIDAEGAFVVTGTGPDFRVPVLHARGLEALRAATATEALSERPRWGLKPMGAEIIRIGDHYVMYFVSKHKARKVNCLAVATSRSATGPYQLVSDKGPMYCPEGILGVIAPHPFRDGATRLYLLFSLFSGERGRADKGIYLARLSDDGLRLESEPTKLIGADQEWENGHIEGPALLKHQGRYHLFYSGSTYKARRNPYAVGYAYADKITGPYTKARDNPFLNSSPGVVNPGSQAILADDCGNVLLFFHAYNNVEMVGRRSSYVTRLSFVDRKPTIDRDFDYGSYACNRAR
jgi:GH43 family beta-xylosidase